MAFNPLQNFLQGQQAGQGQQANRLAGSLAGQMGQGQDISKSDEFQQLMGLDQEKGTKILGAFTNLSKERKQAFFDDMVVGQAMLSSGDSEGARDFFEDRSDAIKGLAGDSFSTDSYINLIDSGNPEGALDSLNQGIAAATKMGYLKEGGAGNKSNFVNKVSPPQTDQETGQQYVIITDPNTETTKRVDVAGGKALTQDAKDSKLVRQSLLDDARKVSKDSFEGLKTVRSGLGAYDDALAAIDAGANSGKLQSFFPSFTEATINLENAGARLGLNIIQATTFGALSSEELKLAMNTAMPPLEPKALRKWIVAKRGAQKKLGRELRKMSIALGKGKMTVTEYLESSGYAEAELNIEDMSDEDLFN